MKKFKIRKAAVGLAVGIALSATVPAQAGLLDWFKNTSAAQEEKTAYSFISNGVTILPDAEAAPILAALGAPVQTFEQDSCAYQGKDKIYTYAGFQIGVNSVNGTDKISFIYLLDNTVSTPEGIKIGSTAAQVVEAYGKAYEEQSGVYRYVLGNTQLSICTTNSVVDAIEYQIAPAN